MVPRASGPQTAWSIIRPASFCGGVGYKPSFGLVAISGTKALAPSLDTVGGFARSVADIALFTAAIAGRPELVPKAPAARPRIGVSRTQPWEQAQPATVAALDEARERLARAGASLSERPTFAAFDRLVPAQLAIMGHETARTLAWERTSPPNQAMPRTPRPFPHRLPATPPAYDAPP